MKETIFIILLLISISGYSQKTVIIDNPKPYFWISANIITSDTTFNEVNIRSKNTFENLKDSVRFVFQSAYGHKFDTTLILKWYKSKYRIELAEINYPKIAKNNLTELFKQADSSAYILEYYHYPPGCESGFNKETIIIFKHGGKIYGFYRNPENYDGSDYSTLSQKKRFSNDFIEKLVSFENNGKQNNEPCFSGFIGMDCGYTRIIFEDHITTFTNNLRKWNGYSEIVELINKLEDYK